MQILRTEVKVIEVHQLSYNIAGCLYNAGLLNQEYLPPSTSDCMSKDQVVKHILEEAAMIIDKAYEKG